jgi:flagellar biosynthetic protein FliR
MMALHIFGESLTGLFIGLCARIVTGCVLIAGTLAANQAGLSNVMIPGAVSPDATAITGTLLGVAVLGFIFTTGLDYLLIEAILDSYWTMPAPGAPGWKIEIADMGDVIVRTVSGSFRAGVWIGFPVLACGMILNTVLGLANRFMPQLQVYFISTPISIVAVLVLLSAMLPTILQIFAGGLTRFMTGHPF